MNDQKEQILFELRANTKSGTTEIIVPARSNISLTSGTITQIEELTRFIEYQPKINIPFFGDVVKFGSVKYKEVQKKYYKEEHS